VNQQCIENEVEVASNSSELTYSVNVCEDIIGYCNNTDEEFKCTDPQKRCYIYPTDEGLCFNKNLWSCDERNKCNDDEVCIDKKCMKIVDEFTGGAKKNLRRTEKKVKLSKGTRCVYVGSRGGEYVKINGEFVPLKKAMKGSK
jgi:hypothetical protein